MTTLLQLKMEKSYLRDRMEYEQKFNKGRIEDETLYRYQAVNMRVKVAESQLLVKK